MIYDMFKRLPHQSKDQKNTKISNVLLTTHHHQLVFRIDTDAPTEYMKRWKAFKLSCEEGGKEKIVEQIKFYCKLENTKKLPYLDRAEGGMGGGNNTIHKQLRFRKKKWCSVPRYVDDIIIDQIYSTELEKWTYDELDDIIYAFIQMANDKVQGQCVRGCIELTNDDYS